MKNKYFKAFTCFIALSLFAVISNAQVKEIVLDLPAFDAVVIDYDFDVTVVPSRTYSIELSVDSVLEDYVQANVKNHTLYLTLDSKSLPSDVKKLYKGRNAAAPLLDATIHMPSDVSSITMSGASVLSVNDDYECTGMTITLSENAYVKKFAIDASKVTLNTSGKSSADMVIYADDIVINAAGSSTIGVEQDSQSLEVNASGSATVRTEGETLDATVKSSGTSKVSLIGKTNSLNVEGASFSSVDALNLKTSECSVKLTGNCKVYEAATETLHIDMSGSSNLTFDGEPAIDIINIKSSTVQRYSNK